MIRERDATAAEVPVSDGEIGAHQTCVGLEHRSRAASHSIGSDLPDRQPTGVGLGDANDRAGFARRHLGQGGEGVERIVDRSTESLPRLGRDFDQSCNAFRAGRANNQDGVVDEISELG